jgi:hypothetical protein
MISKDQTSQEDSVSLKPQPWRWTNPRVLVEHPDEAAGMEIASGLRYAGYAVAHCPGPRGHAKCPLTGPEGCATAHDADVLVCSLGYEGDGSREILRELRMRFPQTPMIVETPQQVDADLGDLLEGCWQIPAPATPQQIVAAVKGLSAESASEG